MRFSTANLDRLPWRRLSALCTDPGVEPHQRRLAESRLAARLDRLALGEKITLARICSRALIPELAACRLPEVIAALLQNPRLDGSHVLRFLDDDELPGDALRRVAEHHRWGETIPVAGRILRHPNTPVHTALKLAGRLPADELTHLLEAGGLPGVVEIQARRIAGRKRGTPEKPQQDGSG